MDQEMDHVELGCPDIHGAGWEVERECRLKDELRRAGLAAQAMHAIGDIAEHFPPTEASKCFVYGVPAAATTWTGGSKLTIRWTLEPFRQVMG